MRVYRRTYKGLIRKAKSKASALIYPEYKVGDKVVIVPNILQIDERITGVTDGYVGEQVRRRKRYRVLLNKRAIGKIMKMVVADIYVKFDIKGSIAKKYGLDKPLLVRKQMIKPLK